MNTYNQSTDFINARDLRMRDDADEAFNGLIRDEYDKLQEAVYDGIFDKNIFLKPDQEKRLDSLLMEFATERASLRSRGIL